MNEIFCGPIMLYDARCNPQFIAADMLFLCSIYGAIMLWSMT